MGRSIMWSVSCLAILTTGTLLAQEETDQFSFGQYFECDPNREDFADLLVEHTLGPVFDKHVESGELTGWSWLSHNAGGHWRKLLVMTANDLDTLLDTRDKMFEDQESIDDSLQELTSICPRHDDLVWARVTGSPVATQSQTSSPRSYSTYYLCDVARQERADEIVEQLFKPAADALVAPGKLDAWFWSAHVIGGRFRRLMAHQGQSFAGMIAAVNEYNQAASEANEAMANEFSEICNSHVDYLWDIVLPKP